ncbi:hypothetical protein AGMMS49944_17580 [Spirochaetia bacterium]|nr:hypothetical protein AGMMS49944_17580 [Spirochaetia bacterium]
MHQMGEAQAGTSADPVYRLVRFVIQLLVFLLLVVVSTLLLRPLQQSLKAGMTQFRDGLLARAELFLDREIEYASMGPSLFGSLDIRGIRIYTAGETEASGVEPEITIERFRLAYSFGDLIRGRLPESIRSVRIDRPVVHLEWEGDIENPSAPDSADPRSEGMRNIAALIPEDILFRVRGGEFRLRRAENTIRVEGLNFETRAEAGRFLFSGKWSAQAELAGLFDQPFAAAMSGRINGTLSRDLNNGSVQLRLPAFSGDSFVLRPLTVNLTLTERELELRKINDRLPVDLSLNYEFDTRRLSASFRAEDFTPRDLLTFTGPWRNYNSYLGIRSSGFASLEHSPGEGVSYAIDLSGSLPASTAAGAISYAVAGKGNERYFGFTRCNFLLPQGALAYSGGMGLKPFAPNGTLQIKDFTLTGDGGISGDITLSTTGRTINLFGETLTMGGGQGPLVTLSALDGDLTREDTGLSFNLSALRFRNIESYENVQLGTLSLSGSFDTDPRQLQASLALESVSVADLLNSIRPLTAFAPWAEADLITKDIAITTEVFVTTDFNHILYNAPRLVAAYSGKRDFLTLVSVAGTDRRFELSEGRVVWTEGSAEAAGYADFSNPDDITFAFRTSYKDTLYSLEGEYLDRRSLSIRGSYGLQVYVTANDSGYGGYSGYIEAVSLPISWNDQAARINLLVSLRYDDPEYWSLTVDHFDVQDLVTPVSPITALSISGEVNQSGLLFRRIVFDDGRGPLSGRAAASWGRGFANPTGNLVIRNQGGAEIARIDGAYREKAVDIAFSGTGLNLGRFLQNSYNAVLSGNGELHWESRDSYSATLTLDELSARIEDNAITLAGSAELNQDVISLHNIRGRYNTLEGEVNLLRINRQLSTAQAEAQIRGGFMGRNLDMSFSTDLNFVPVGSWFSLPQAMDTFNGSLLVQNIRLDAIRSREPFDFTFSRDRSRISLSGGPGDMLRLQVSDEDASGGRAFYAAFSNPAPFRGSVVGAITDGTIEARTSNMYLDLSSLWRFIPVKEKINVPGGFVDLSLEIRGSLGDPEFFGSARVNSLRIQVPQFVREDIQPVPITLSLEGNEMRFGPVSARVGSGAGTIAGWFRFDRWVPTIFNLDIQVPDATPIPFGVDIGGIQASGDASGQLMLAMGDQVLKVSGNLLGNNAEITLGTRNTQTPAAISQNITTVTDLTIKTGPKVEFIYPTRDFPLIRGSPEAGTGISITSDSLSGHFTVEGDVAIRRGEIFYFQRSFYIREGVLSFNESDTHFEPLITARAETRDRTGEGPVTISMIVDSSPLQSFSARLESNPPLSQFEILSLLGQNFAGTLSAEDPNGAIRSIVLASGDVLSQFILYRRAERTIRDILRLDMFSFRTQILQNAFVQATGLQSTAAGSQSTDSERQAPVDRTGGFGNYLDNTTVFFGKYFGPNVFGQAMLSFRYDENRITFGDISRGGVTLGAGISLEPEIEVEFRGPLFDIQVNFAPSHLENMFVNDLSFTFSRKWSFRNFRDLWKKER